MSDAASTTPAGSYRFPYKRRGKAIRALLAVTVLASALACRHTSATGVSGLPPADTSLDPARLVINAPLYVCNRWWNRAPLPSGMSVIVDVKFGRLTSTDPLDRPLEPHRRRVLSRGAKILHTFQLPAYRISILSDSIPSLSDYDRVVVYEVRSLSRYDWRVLVNYDTAHQVDANDEARFVAHGGRITARWPSINAIGGDLPDRSLPILRADGRIRFVEADHPFCPE